MHFISTFGLELDPRARRELGGHVSAVKMEVLKATSRVNVLEGRRGLKSILSRGVVEVVRR